MIYEYSNLQGYLKAELESRIQFNRRYSLRAFASRLGLAPSTTVEILNGRKCLSIDRASVVADALQLQRSEKQYFLWLVCIGLSDDLFFHEMVQEQMKCLRESFGVVELKTGIESL